MAKEKGTKAPRAPSVRRQGVHASVPSVLTVLLLLVAGWGYYRQQDTERLTVELAAAQEEATRQTDRVLSQHRLLEDVVPWFVGQGEPPEALFQEHPEYALADVARQRKEAIVGELIRFYHPNLAEG